MGGSSYGTVFRITTYGESHGPAIGVVVDGAEAGIELQVEQIQHELNRRRPGQSAITTQRQEQDQVELLSGVFEGKTTGQPISLLIRNKDAQSQAYDAIQNLLRPGHATMAYQAKWGSLDYRGGGRASARETAARVAAGAVAKITLAKYDIKTTAYVVQVGALKAHECDLSHIDFLPSGMPNSMRCPDIECAKKMESLIAEVKQQGDSLGGVIEAQIFGLPPGLGEPVFDKLDAEIAKALMGIPAVKAVEIGEGVDAGKMRGSEFNDPFYKEGSTIKTRTNHCGGILGGISDGMPIIVRATFKPTSSITIPLETVTIEGKSAQIKTEGRHDPCVVPRAVPIVEAMLNCVVLDFLYRQRMNAKR